VYQGRDLSNISFLLTAEAEELDYLTYVQTDENFEDFSLYDKIKCKSNDLLYFGIEGDLNWAIIPLQKAFLSYGLGGVKFVLMAIYATRDSLAKTKQTAKNFKKDTDLTWNLRYEPDHDAVKRAIQGERGANFPLACLLWVEKRHFVAIDLSTKKNC
jgi:hypothetical protein